MRRTVREKGFMRCWTFGRRRLDSLLLQVPLALLLGRFLQSRAPLLAQLRQLALQPPVQPLDAAFVAGASIEARNALEQHRLRAPLRREEADAVRRHVDAP